MLDKGDLRELKSASGGAWGGVGINDEFLKFMVKLFGQEIFNEFKREYMNQYFELERKFESEKRHMKLGDGNSIIIPLPSALLKKYADKVQVPLSEVLSQTTYRDGAEIIQEQLEIKSALTESFFENTMKTIVKHVKDIFSQREARNITNILMVGGFSESAIVRDRIKKEFASKTVMVPHEAGSAVLKGAVLFGHNPNIISARVCPYTYGLHTRKAFNKTRHDEKRAKTVNGKKVVDKVFDKHLEIGETVYIAEKLKQHAFYIIDRENPVWEVYKSTSKDPIYCDDKTCEHIGRLKVTLTGSANTGKRRELGVRMICRGTELEAEAIDKDSGESQIARFNFLKWAKETDIEIFYGHDSAWNIDFGVSWHTAWNMNLEHLAIGRLLLAVPILHS